MSPTRLGCLAFFLWAGNASAQPALYFIHVDHLNTPRLVADAAGTTVWKWDQQEPFADNPADENPSGLGAFDLPLRLPGQRYDRETGLHYNYYRDYDPSLGIYEQSDLIGLYGGLNTYAYVGGNPLSFSDPLGVARKKDPNGEECQALARKIANVKKDIEKRYREYAGNPAGLPESGPPGSKPRETRQGHLHLIRTLEARLKELEKKYQEECGEECPPEESPLMKALKSLFFQPSTRPDDLIGDESGRAKDRQLLGIPGLPSGVPVFP